MHESLEPEADSNLMSNECPLCYDLATFQLPADNHLAGSINAVHLKD